MTSVPRDVASERLVIAVTPAQRELFERAAAAVGRSLAEFVVGSAESAAEEVLCSDHDPRLTAEDTIAILEAMENPPAPNDNLRQLAREYRELFGEPTE
jgi:uncharacterized protein (DUF1778 family)